MRQRFVLFLFLLSSASVARADLSGFFDRADSFLSSYVRSGKVAYASIKSNPATLTALVSEIGGMSLSGASATERKAFYINAYNVLVIKGIVDNYPTSSPMKISGFFDSKRYTVAGESMTLNQLEKSKLLAATGDARLHFVLVCAAQSCPPLASNAYRPETLESTLTQRTRAALSRPQVVRIDNGKKRIYVSKLFEWYDADFKKVASSYRAYIDKYRSTPLPSYDIYTQDYDWSLND